MNPIKVKQTGKANCEFVVRNPKKIEFWKMVAEKLSGTCGLVATTYEENKTKKEKGK